VATTRPFFTPTITPHPVPQKRQGAFDHLICNDSIPPATGCASAGMLMFAAAAATAAAWDFKTSRRVTFIALISGGVSCDLFENHVCREHSGEACNLDQARPHRVGVGALEHDDDLSGRVMEHFDAAHRG
jgi:hypothetical protein